MNMRRPTSIVTGLLALLALPAPAFALTAADARIGSHPGFVRVVVDFTGGPLEVNDADAVDPSPIDGHARVDVRGPSIRTRSIDRRAAGVRVRVQQASNRLRIRVTSRRRALKYVRVWGLHGPERLVLDFYRARPPSRAAEIRTGTRRCLRLTSVRREGRGVRVRGVERQLFEGAFVLRVRDASGRVVGRRVMTARGAFDARVSYRVARRQAGTLEGVAASAKDGSLACLVQRRIALRP